MRSSMDRSLLLDGKQWRSNMASTAATNFQRTSGHLRFPCFGNPEISVVFGHQFGLNCSALLRRIAKLPDLILQAPDLIFRVDERIFRVGDVIVDLAYAAGKIILLDGAGLRCISQCAREFDGRSQPSQALTKSICAILPRVDSEPLGRANLAARTPGRDAE